MTFHEAVFYFPGTREEQSLRCTFDWLFFSLWASSTTKQAHVTEPRMAWSIVMSSYDVNRMWNLIGVSFCIDRGASLEQRRV